MRTPLRMSGSARRRSSLTEGDLIDIATDLFNIHRWNTQNGWETRVGKDYVGVSEDLILPVNFIDTGCGVEKLL